MTKLYRRYRCVMGMAEPAEFAYSGVLISNLKILCALPTGLKINLKSNFVTFSNTTSY